MGTLTIGEALIRRAGKFKPGLFSARFLNEAVFNVCLQSLSAQLLLPATIAIEKDHREIGSLQESPQVVVRVAVASRVTLDESFDSEGNLSNTK